MQRGLRVVSSALALGLLCGCTTAEYNRLRGDAYALDAVDRDAPEDGSVAQCRPEGLVLYRGEAVKLQPPSSVAEAFQVRLRRFEAVVTQLGERVYGRGPSHVVHAGTYACRAVEHRRGRLSEHALGNAIDVTGFRFPPLGASNSGGRANGGNTPDESEAIPKRLRGAFTITVGRDWPRANANATEEGEVQAAHRRFFEGLAESLRDGDVFRGVIGPPDPAHETHLHLDMAPWPYRRL